MVLCTAQVFIDERNESRDALARHDQVSEVNIGSNTLPLCGGMRRRRVAGALPRGIIPFINFEFCIINYAFKKYWHYYSIICVKPLVFEFFMFYIMYCDQYGFLIYK